MKKVLVLGSEGNIGKPLVTALRESGYDVMESDIKPAWRDNYLMADINEPVDLLPAFDKKPDVVILLSAMVSRVTCEQASCLAVSTNLGGINNVLQLCKRYDCMTVFFSTSEIYGPNCEVMSEDSPDIQPNNRYGLTKYLGEKLVEYEVREHGLRAVTLRPFMIYDENEDLGEHRSAMIRFASNLAVGKSIEVHRGSKRGWLHISDAVRAIRAAMDVDEYAAINIGHPEIAPIEDLAEMIRVELDVSEELVGLKDIPSRMTLVKNPDLTRQTEILGVTPEVSLADGVTRVCSKIRERIAQ